MGLWKEVEKLRYDKRLMDWNISQGKMTKAEYQKHFASLPDSAENVDASHMPEAGGRTGAFRYDSSSDDDNEET